MSNVVLLELGLALALVLLTLDTGLLPIAIAVVAVLALITLSRWHGRWVTQWAAIVVRFAARTKDRRVPSPLAQDDSAALARRSASTPVGPEDARVGLLRLFVDDLVVATSTDHEQQPIGLAWHRGTWTAAVLIDPQPAMVSPVGTHSDIPLEALAGCLHDRGVVLDTVQVIWHCYPGSATLAPDSPALAAYHEVLGPLPAAARRTTWVTVRLDPRRCPEAVRERGGGVSGAHRALIGAVSRVRGALGAAGMDSHALDADELLRAGLAGAELSSAAGRGQEVGLQERWRGATAGGVGHASFAVTGWHGAPGGLSALTGVRALSTTVVVALSPGEDDGAVGVRSLVRLSDRTPSGLAAAAGRLRSAAGSTGVRLAPLNGQQAAGIAATLPLGGTA